MKYIVIAVDKNGIERKVGGFRRKKDRIACMVFWQEFVSNGNSPNVDLVLYQVGRFGERKYVIDDY